MQMWQISQQMVSKKLMLCLILNTDDFGLTQGVNDAVFELAALGTLSSTTVMVNMPYAEDARNLLKIPDFGVGLHFNLTEGCPVSAASAVPSLVNSDGKFYDYPTFRKRLQSGKIKKETIDQELEAQWVRLTEILGGPGGHLDSHQNIHKLIPLSQAFVRFGRKNPGLGVRNPRRFVADTQANNQRVLSSFRYHLMKGNAMRALSDLYLFQIGRMLSKAFWVPNGELHAANFKKLELLEAIRVGELRNLTPSGNFEIACHPATNTDGLSRSKMTEKRILEYQCMKDSDFCNSVKGVISHWH